MRRSTPSKSIALLSQCHTSNSHSSVQWLNSCNLYAKATMCHLDSSSTPTTPSTPTSPLSSTTDVLSPSTLERKIKTLKEESSGKSCCWKNFKGPGVGAVVKRGTSEEHLILTRSALICVLLFRRSLSITFYMRYFQNDFSWIVAQSATYFVHSLFSHKYTATLSSLK